MAIEIVDLSMKNCDFPIKHGDFPIKHGDFPMKNGDFPIKHGDFPMKNGGSFHRFSYVWGFAKDIARSSSGDELNQELPSLGERSHGISLNIMGCLPSGYD